MNTCSNCTQCNLCCLLIYVLCYLCSKKLLLRVAEICAGIEALQAKVGKAKKTDSLRPPPTGLAEQMQQVGALISIAVPCFPLCCLFGREIQYSDEGSVSHIYLLLGKNYCQCLHYPSALLYFCADIWRRDSRRAVLRRQARTRRCGGGSGGASHPALRARQRPCQARESCHMYDSRSVYINARNDLYVHLSTQLFAAIATLQIHPLLDHKSLSNACSHRLC